MTGRLKPGAILRILGALLVLASLGLPRVNHGAGVTLTGGDSTSLVIAAAFMLVGGVASIAAPDSKVTRYGLIATIAAAWFVFRAYTNANDLVSMIQSSGVRASVGSQVWVAASGVAAGLVGNALDRRRTAAA